MSSSPGSSECAEPLRSKALEVLDEVVLMLIGNKQIAKWNLSMGEYYTCALGCHWQLELLEVV